MKKLGLIVGLALCSVLMITQNALAILYLPDVQFDSIGIAEYIASTGKFTIKATSDKVIFDSSLTPYWIDHSVADDADFYAEYVSGGDSGTWYFQGDSAVAPGISIKGKLFSPPGGFANSGTLITGNITGLNYDNNTPGYVRGTFDITGGDLYSYYAGTGYKGLYLINLEFGTGSTNPSGSANNFKSVGAKGDISPVPEPASLLLLGSGLLGLAVFGNMKRKIG